MRVRRRLLEPLRNVGSRTAVRFLLGSGGGLAIDLGGFTLLTALGVLPFVANLVSTALAITTVYLLVTRFAFRVAPTWRTYAAFFAWYGASAVVVSSAIAVLSHGDQGLAVIVKVCTVPITFTTNFLFGRWLFAGGAERGLERVSSLWASTDATDARPHERSVEAVLLRRSLRRPRVLVAAVVTVAFVVLILPLNLGVSFQVPANRRGELLAHLLQIAFAITLFGAVLFVLRLAQAYRLRSVRHRRWVRIAVAYLAVNLVLLALIYPGYWVWDEYYVLDSAKAYSLDAWQGYLTTLYYTAGLFLGPAPVVILLLQLVLIALITGYVVSLLMARLRRPLLAVLAAVPLLSFPVLLNNQYPLRLTLYAYLLLLLVVRLGLIAERRHEASPRRAAFLGFCALIGVLAFWRTEGVFLLLLLPVAFVLCGLHRVDRTAIRPTLATTSVGIAMVLLVTWLTSTTSAPAYQVTAIMNPLSTMIQSPLQSPNLANDRTVIDRVIDLQVLKKWPAYLETPALWNGGLRPDFATHTAGLIPAFADLVVHNPGPFLDNRWHAFLAANSMQQMWLPQVQNLRAYDGNPGIVIQREHFGSTNFGARPIDAPFKAAVERHMLLWTADQQITLLGQIVWNVLPPLVLTLLLGLVSAFRRRWWWVLGSAVTLAYAGLVFLSEPASYFMYFFPAFLLGSALVTGAVVLGLDAVLSRSAQRAPATRALPGIRATARPSILLAIPAYNCGPQIGRVLAALTPELLSRLDAVVVIDNRSTDHTAQAAESAGVRLGSKFQVWRNRENFGLGGSHKVAFNHGIENGFDYVAIVHGDDQADPEDLHRLIDRAAASDAAAVLGARFVRGSRRIGYSKVRVIGNRAINVAFTAITGRRTVDLGSGINLFRTAELRDRRYVAFDDGITFNIDLLLDYYRTRARLAYEPITWREEDQVSNARNVAVGRAALEKLVRWRFGRSHGRPAARAYGFEVIA